MKVNQKKSSQVPGQYYGYSLQATRFLSRLLEGDSDWDVSLEVFEDVGIETPNGYRIAEQDKSAPLSNPVADRSVELWKTFSNWIHAAKSGQIDPEKAIFEIYVSHPKTGDIVASFSKACSSKDSMLAYRGAKNSLWGPTPKFPQKPSVSNSIKSYVSDVFEADEDLVCKIIQNFKLNCGSGSPQADLHAQLSKIVPEEIIDDTLKYSLGWVKREIDILLEQQKIAVITVGPFRNEFFSFIRRLDRRNFLHSFASAPSPEEVESQSLMTYVRQLEILEEDDDHKIRAINDFLRAESDRTIWAEKGWVHELSFDDFDLNLENSWRNLKKITDIELSGRSEVERGQSLCAKCELHHAPLQGNDTLPHFISGSFHTLSNNKVIGWHPNYKKLLKEG